MSSAVKHIYIYIVINTGQPSNQQTQVWGYGIIMRYALVFVPCWLIVIGAVGSCSETAVAVAVALVGIIVRCCRLRGAGQFFHFFFFPISDPCVPVTVTGHTSRCHSTTAAVQQQHVVGDATTTDQHHAHAWRFVVYTSSIYSVS